MKRGWADKWAAGNAKDSQSESTGQSTATGTPRITLPLKDALDPSVPRYRSLEGTITVEFRKRVYATGHCYVSSHIVACDGITEHNNPVAEDILSQVEEDGEPPFGLQSQNFPDAANGPKVGTNEIVFNPKKAFPGNLQLLIDKGFVRDTGK